jgi:hypothetical protein
MMHKTSNIPLRIEYKLVETVPFLFFEENMIMQKAVMIAI